MIIGVIKIADPLTMNALGALLSIGILGFIAGMILVAILLGIAAYIYVSIACYTIFRKLKSSNAVLALIPLVNLVAIPVMVWQLSDTPLWTVVLFWAGALLFFIPVLGPLLLLAALGMLTWWLWKVAEKRKQPGWLGILASPVVIPIPYIGPIVYVVFLGILAWSEKRLG